jgi:excisionase family DNA binding protein
MAVSTSKASYTPAEVAELTGYDERTIRRRCDDGTIPCVQLSEGGHRRIPGEWVRRKVISLGLARSSSDTSGRNGQD